MRQKAVALLIVLMIGGVTTSVLYSPAQLRGPAVSAVTVPLPPPLEPVTAVAVVEATPVVKASRPPLASAPIPLTTVAAPPRTEPQRPFVEEVPPSLVASTPLAAAAPLADSTRGAVPGQPAAHETRRGPFEIAGRSIGTAFVTTGRTLGTAFKHVF